MLNTIILAGILIKIVTENNKAWRIQALLFIRTKFFGARFLRTKFLRTKFLRTKFLRTKLAE